MSNEKMREEFEAWAVNYGVDDYESAWQAWKASRAALCVELPSKTNDESDERSIWYDHAINEAQGALDAAGVRYK